jgi:hypothetical protein
MKVRLVNPVIDLPEIIARQLMREGKATAVAEHAAVVRPARNAARRISKPNSRKG